MHEESDLQSKRTYRCANCQKTFTLPLGSSVVAEAESIAMFPTVPEKDMVVVCDECYPKLAEKALKLIRQKKSP